MHITEHEQNSRMDHTGGEGHHNALIIKVKQEVQARATTKRASKRQRQEQRQKMKMER
jgi:hypothetical protein